MHLFTIQKARAKNRKTQAMHSSELRLLRCYRGAVELNNIGVRLIERGACKNAIGILTESVIALDYCSLSDRSETYRACLEDTRGPELDFSIQLRIDRARKYLETPIKTKSCIAIQTILFDRNSMPFELAPLREGLEVSSSWLPLLKIDCSTVDHCSEPHDHPAMDIETSVILSNLAIAYLCFSRTEHEARRLPSLDHGVGSRFLERALVLFKRANDILLLFRDPGKLDVLEQCQVLGVSALILKCLLDLFRPNFDEGEVSNLRERLNLVRIAFDDILPCIEMSSAAAA